jgi:hypothetical protein
VGRGSGPIVKDWMMTGDGLKARELIHRQVVYLRFGSQNTTRVVFRNLSIVVKLGLDVSRTRRYGGRTQGPTAVLLMEVPNARYVARATFFPCGCS